jgi:lysozyme family protein
MAVFDCAVHSGPSRSIKLLQRACGVVEDGVLGPVTLASAGTVDPLKVIAVRRDFLEGLIKKDPSQEVFRKGWMNRTDDLAATMSRSSKNSQRAMRAPNM